MFRGAYQIINVEHDITPGNMTTSFKGVRINKNKIPMVKTCLNLNSMLDVMSGQTSYDVAKNNAFITNFTGTTFGDPAFGDAMKGIPFDANYNYNKCINDLGPYLTISKITSHNSSKEAFDETNPFLRNMVYLIGKKMKEHGLGVNITSMTRASDEYSPNSSSDHAIGKIVNNKFIFKGSTRRMELNGPDGNGVEKKYSEMGCAVDMNGMLSNGVVDKTNASIPLFHLIATEFTNNIRQLIWEVSRGRGTSEDCISNCVHLSSYGPRGKNGTDKTEIFVASGSEPWKSVKADNTKNPIKAPTNLPPMFIKTLYDMSKSNKLDGIKLNNFSYPVTHELIDGWCREMHLV